MDRRVQWGENFEIGGEIALLNGDNMSVFSMILQYNLKIEFICYQQMYTITPERDGRECLKCLDVDFLRPASCYLVLLD